MEALVLNLMGMSGSLAPPLVPDLTSCSLGRVLFPVSLLNLGIVDLYRTVSGVQQSDFFTHKRAYSFSYSVFVVIYYKILSMVPYAMQKGLVFSVLYTIVCVC